MQLVNQSCATRYYKTQAYVFLVSKGCVVVHVGESKCVNTDTHERRDLVWQVYKSLLAGYCEGGYSCWLWLKCKQKLSSEKGRACEFEGWSTLTVLHTQLKKKKTHSSRSLHGWATLERHTPIMYSIHTVYIGKYTFCLVPFFFFRQNVPYSGNEK